MASRFFTFALAVMTLLGSLVAPMEVRADEAEETSPCTPEGEQAAQVVMDHLAAQLPVPALEVEPCWATTSTAALRTAISVDVGGQEVLVFEAQNRTLFYAGSETLLGRRNDDTCAEGFTAHRGGVIQAGSRRSSMLSDRMPTVCLQDTNDLRDPTADQRRANSARSRRNSQRIEELGTTAQGLAQRLDVLWRDCDEGEPGEHCGLVAELVLSGQVTEAKVEQLEADAADQRRRIGELEASDRRQNRRIGLNESVLRSQIARSNRRGMGFGGFVEAGPTVNTYGARLVEDGVTTDLHGIGSADLLAGFSVHFDGNVFAGLRVSGLVGLGRLGGGDAIRFGGALYGMFLFGQDTRVGVTVGARMIRMTRGSSFATIGGAQLGLMVRVPVEVTNLNKPDAARALVFHLVGFAGPAAPTTLVDETGKLIAGLGTDVGGPHRGGALTVGFEWDFTTRTRSVAPRPITAASDERGEQETSTVTVTATDDEGNTRSATVTVEVEEGDSSDEE